MTLIMTHTTAYCPIAKTFNILHVMKRRKPHIQNIYHHLFFVFNTLVLNIMFAVIMIFETIVKRFVLRP